MAAGRNLFGLSAQAKARLIEKLASAAATRMAPAAPRRGVPGVSGGASSRLDVAQLDRHQGIHPHLGERP